MQLPRKLIASLAFVCLLISTSSNATDYDQLSDAELDQRLAYLNKSFDEIESPSDYWHYGWSGFYAVSAVAQAAKAADESDSDDSTKLWVGAIKSTGGLAMMLMKPLPIVHGLDEYQSMPATTRAQKIEQLKKAEQLLRHSAWRANERYTWKPHAITIGANLIGAAAIAAFGDSSDALSSSALGIVIGEAAIWTQPSAAEQQWENYKTTYGDSQTALQWQLRPTYNGVEFELRF
ncbi:hypothetical protein K0504_00015 [Neiella marina]|uniref:Secreted protein n=1 Tax=Neiella holothuriorum TaxID=2870530 RepID=A0ABS7EAM8_9GAMM|nr:hypothetical protein [Neiella holothuriorum]MBW8189402.1 hypothetical protein [Neiella holothuriorum]